MSVPFTYSKKTSCCPCGEHERFSKLTSHSSGGKCWTCDKFFPPEKEKAYVPIQVPQSKPPKPMENSLPSVHSPKTFVREHIYWDEAGDNYLMKVMIYKDSQGKKQCYQYSWKGEIVWDETEQVDKKLGEWIPGIEGVKLTLYNAPLLDIYRKNLHPDEYAVYIVEGEKDADTLWDRHGLLTVCNPMGAGKWRKHYSELLRGLNCIILPDNDEAGFRHAQQVYDSLRGIAHKVMIYNLTNSMPGLPQKGDVTDYIQRGGTL